MCARWQGSTCSSVCLPGLFLCVVISGPTGRGFDLADLARWAYMESASIDSPTASSPPGRLPYSTRDWIRYQLRRQQIINGDYQASITKTNVYPTGGRQDVPSWLGWGAFSQSGIFAFALLRAWHVTGDAKYYDAAIRNLDVQLGLNPLSISYITALGHVRRCVSGVSLVG